MTNVLTGFKLSCNKVFRQFDWPSAVVNSCF